MVYKSKARDRKWHRNFMRVKRRLSGTKKEVVTPSTSGSAESVKSEPRVRYLSKAELNLLEGEDGWTDYDTGGLSW